MRLKNETKYRTADLRAFVRAGLGAKGASTNKVVEVGYGRTGVYCGGAAIVGRGGVESLWIRLSVPNRGKDAGGTWVPENRPTGDRDGEHSIQLIGGVPTHFRKVYRDADAYPELPDDVLLDLARTLEHEIDHSLGLNHRDMAPSRSLRPTWHQGLRIRREEPKAKVTAAARVAKRAAHAKEMLLAHERALAQERRLVAKWRKRVKYYERKYP